jgi:hypothetical protein
MPSRSNPNTPSSLKRKTARTLKTKRQTTQQNKISKPKPRTSQAIRRAAAPSQKKARKLERKAGFAKKRMMVEMGEVEMKDVIGEKKNEASEDAEGLERRRVKQRMDVDQEKRDLDDELGEGGRR